MVSFHGIASGKLRGMVARAKRPRKAKPLRICADLHSNPRQVREKNTELTGSSTRGSAPTVCRKLHCTFDLHGSRVRQSKSRVPEGQDLLPKRVRAKIS